MAGLQTFPRKEEADLFWKYWWHKFSIKWSRL